MRVVFAGTPEFAVPALEALAVARHDIAAVYTQPDRPAGRGRKLTASPVKQTAARLGIPVAQPQSLRTDGAAQELARYSPDVMVVVAYGLLLPPAVLGVPRYGCINIHASLLPRWRGAAPIQRAILAGDRESGISIMRMEAGLDTGPVYSQKLVQIAGNDTGGSLHDKLSALGASAIVETLEAIEFGKAQARPQTEAGVTYARKLEKSEALIDWAQSSVELERKVRAFNPWPVAETRWQGKQLRVWAAHIVGIPDYVMPAKADIQDLSAPKMDSRFRGNDGGGIVEPGTVIAATNEGIVVACGEGALSIQSLQLPGGKPISAAEFLNSHDLSNASFG